MILLDTCALIWTVNDDPISADALRIINKAQKAGGLYLSPVSAWEIGILARRGRVALDLPAEAYVSRVFNKAGVRVAPLTPEIAVRASYLPGDLHADPADRLLIATAILMGLRLVTRDRDMIEYGARGYVSVLRC